MLRAEALTADLSLVDGLSDGEVCRFAQHGIDLRHLAVVAVVFAARLGPSVLLLHPSHA